jgi:hypothetical protein
MGRICQNDRRPIPVKPENQPEPARSPGMTAIPATH